METVCREVQKFISACESIHSRLDQGGLLTLDEQELIEISARDLLEKLKVQKSRI